MQTQILTMITPIMALIFSAVFAGLWWRDRSKSYILAYSAGFGGLFLTFAFAVILVPGRDIIIWNFIHLLACLGSTALVWGSARRLGGRSPMVACLAIWLVSSVLMSFGLYYENFEVSLIAQNGASGLIFMLASVVLWHASSPHILDRALIWVFAALAFHGLTRPLEAMLLSSISVASAGPVLHAINIVALALLSSMMAMIMLAQLVLDKASAKTEEAGFDPLSGLPNRRRFEASAAAIHSRSVVEGKPVCLIMIDIDHFKQVNDTWGHAVGDQLIKNFGELIAGNIRPSDVGGRIGGEEFSIIVWDCDLDQGCKLAERIRLAAPHLRARRGEEDAVVTASFGVAQWLSNGAYATASNDADKALYRSKANGRNQVSFATAAEGIGTFSSTVECQGEAAQFNVVPISA